MDMNHNYVDNCKGQANSIEWICQMLREHDFPSTGAIADYGCGPATSTIEPLGHVTTENAPIYLVDAQRDPVLWEQALGRVQNASSIGKLYFTCQH